MDTPHIQSALTYDDRFVAEHHSEPPDSTHQPGTALRSGKDSQINETVAQCIETARSAGDRWTRTPLAERLRLVRELRLALGRDPRLLAELIPREALVESLLAEILPLADACRFLEREARPILRERTLSSRGRPMWLWGTRVRLRREPLGLVLILSPRNYPLMLPGIQAIQALTAGNTVLLKPAPGCRAALVGLVDLAGRAGFPDGVIQVLPEVVEAGEIAIRQGVDKVLLTGSATTGRLVGRQLAEGGTPATMELSGCDAVFVHETADLDLVCDCLMFGLTMNHSQTCIAPRRIFVTHGQADQLASRLLERISRRRHPGHLGPSIQRTIPEHVRAEVGVHVQQAVKAGARLLTDSLSADESRPLLTDITVVDHVTSRMELARSDLFAPVTSILRVSSMDEAIRLDSDCPYALGASLFGSVGECERLAGEIDAGCLVINDMVAHTADPRAPFGGRGRSGYGMTRGPAGLEELTQLKVIITPFRWFKPHLAEPTPVDSDVAEYLIRMEHSESPLARLRAVPGMIRSTFSQLRYRRSSRNSS